MLSFPVEPAAWSLRGKPPEELPHGLLTPPEFVRELIAEEKAKFGPAIFTAETEERALSQHTLQWFFDSLGHEVLYRQTPDGPEVLAVGFDEERAYTKGMSLEDQHKLKRRLP